ncbi:hypothetical protein H5200_12085 [Pseudoalteromonas sp. SG43-7]|uniref:hypothetical protein n=1 Tax=Pseudoalteromonas sp. SG43-7 TaxID=2760966 RepID=UPI001600FE04|nr:hypothetical protein [Pseudoalteromonas sp. SG43-7]MBB1422659.1 hypothetical protein [Pseudoalteromonas sp. SG43-7]
MERLNNVWQQALDNKDSATALLALINEHNDLLYLWKEPSYEDEPINYHVKIIEKLDNPYRNENDELFDDYQPILIPDTNNDLALLIKQSGVTPMNWGNELA